MKKFVPLFMIASLVSLAVVHAADDLGDLDALLNDPDLIGDTTGANATGDITTGTTNEATTEETTTGDEVVDQKIQVNVKDTGSDYIEITFDKVGDYTNYKVYYAPSGNNNLEEEDVQLTGDMADVKITGLQPDTEYQIVVKAFDDNGNPVEATTSDPITAKTKQAHNAPSDNVIYNPTVKVEGNKIIISWKPGADVQKVQISMSEDGQTFKPIATVDASKKTYTIDAKTTGKKYIKLVPIAKDGTLGVCKVGTAEVPYVTANVQPKKEAQKKMGHPKTGPETYLLIILAILAYVAYSYKKRQA